MSLESDDGMSFIKNNSLGPVNTKLGKMQRDSINATIKALKVRRASYKNFKKKQTFQRKESMPRKIPDQKYLNI